MPIYQFRYDGSQGTNRKQCQDPTVTNDDQAVDYYLAGFEGATLNNYSKEIFRLRLWAQEVCAKPLSSLDQLDMRKYAIFLSAVPAEWCGISSGGAERGEPGWKPFVSSLSPESKASALRTLRSVFDWLREASYLGNNPLYWYRTPKGKSSQPVLHKESVESRRLQHDEWKFLVDYLHADQSFAAKRARFVISMLYFLMLRIADVANHTMGNIQRYKGRWVFRGTGKGGKVFRLDMPDTLVEELKSYRRMFGLSELPEPNETTPLVMHMRTNTIEKVGIRRITQIVKDLILNAAKTIPNDEEKERFVKVSSHWFRHTSINHLAENSNADKIQVRDMSRHASLNTTDIYFHSEEDGRAALAKGRTWEPKKHG